MKTVLDLNNQKISIPKGTNAPMLLLEYFAFTEKNVMGQIVDTGSHFTIDIIAPKPYLEKLHNYIIENL